MAVDSFSRELTMSENVDSDGSPDLPAVGIEQRATEGTWTEIKRFVGRFPEVGIVFVLIVLLPVLSRIIPSDDPFGPVLWSLMLVVGLPTLWSFVHKVIPRLFHSGWLVRLLEVCIGAVLATATICIVLALMHMLIPDDENGPRVGIFGRAYAFVFGDNQGDEGGSSAPPPRITDTEPPVTITEQGRSAGLPSIPAQGEQPTDYSRCIREQRDAGNREGILDCVRYLD